MRSPILVCPDPNITYTLLIDALKYAWSGMLTQEYATIIDDKTVSDQHPITYFSGLLQGSSLKWSALTK